MGGVQKRLTNTNDHLYLCMKVTCSSWDTKLLSIITPYLRSYYPESKSYN